MITGSFQEPTYCAKSPCSISVPLGRFAASHQIQSEQGLFMFLRLSRRQVILASQAQSFSSPVLPAEQMYPPHPQ